METSETGFFGPHDFPPLSVQRITSDQIRLMYAYRDDPSMPAGCD